jgi:hypothetical protein
MAGLATFRDRSPELARGSRNAELLDAAAEGAGVKAEDRGGTAGTGDDPVGVPDTLARRRSLAIRHVSGHRLIALLEIVSPANKDRARHIEDFAAQAVSALDVGVHLLVVDLFPPGRHDPYGIHGVILQRLEQSDEPYDLPAEEPLTLAAYAAGPQVDVYLEHLAVGAALPDMPLFLRPDRYISVPLESTYQAAYRGMPAFWREVLEG